MKTLQQALFLLQFRLQLRLFYSQNNNTISLKVLMLIISNVPDELLL